METQDPTTPSQAPAPQLPPPPKKYQAIYIALGLVVLVLVGFGAYFLGQRSTQIGTNNSQNGQNNVPITPTPTPTLASEGQSGQPEEYITVSWLPKWQERKDLNCVEYSSCVLAGKITNGAYAGSDLFIEVRQELGTSYQHFVLDGGTRVYLNDKNIKISGIHDLPAEINFPNSAYKLKKNFVVSAPFNELKLIRKVFTDPKVGDVYLSDLGCLVAELPDHTAISYDFIIPFVNSEDRVLKATFIDSKSNADSYTYNKIVGCAAQCFYLAVMDENLLMPSSRLIQVGKTSTGENLYGLKDSNDQVLKDLYNDRNTVAYYSADYQAQPESKYTYAQFLEYRPLLYWKDPLGRWVEMKNDRFQVAAEMCKPVIYLYPTETTKLSVKVNPNGGFTFTDPVYQNSWEVEAKPNGDLVDLRTGKSYPYLFWEGIGLNYPEQAAGFVVKNDNIEKFFTEKLALLGLKGREAQDFKDYWVPRLHGLNKPYHKISFLKKEQFDELAPLGVSPVQPNSVIRVMMTAKGLDAFEKLPEQELPAPAQRKGFTLVEWGGVVLK